MTGTEEDLIKIWTDFHNKTYNLAIKANNDEHVNAILWTSHLTSEDNLDKYLDKNYYTIQSWESDEVSSSSSLIFVRG